MHPIRSRPMPVVVIAGIAVTTWTAPSAWAQQPGPADPVSGQVELSFVATGGNSDTQTLGVGGEVAYTTGDWTARGKAALVNSSANDIVTARTWTSQARAERRLSPRIEAFGQFDHLRNRLSGIINRYTGEGGVGLRVSETSAHQLRLLAGAGFTREHRVQGPTATAGPRSSFATANYGARYGWTFSATAELGAEASVTHSLEAADDWRGAVSVSLAAELTSVLSMKLSSRLTYLNRPVPGFGPEDMVTSAALVGRF